MKNDPKAVLQSFFKAQRRVGLLFEEALKTGDRDMAEVWLYVYQVLLADEIKFWEAEVKKQGEENV